MQDGERKELNPAIEQVRPAQTRLKDVVLPASLGRPIDSLAALLEERQGER